MGPAVIASLETFAKVRALHDRATSVGEREAAAGWMAQLARKAGMTVAEAVSKLDAPPMTLRRPSPPHCRILQPERHGRDRRMSEDSAVSSLVDDNARRAEILARYGSASAALLPCRREMALRDATWAYVVPGDPGAGPSLAGWRAGPASSLPPEVLRDVTAAIRAPATAVEMWEEHQHWLYRTEVHQILGGPGLPLWVRARQAVLTARLDALFAALPDDAAREEWRSLAGEDARPGRSLGNGSVPPDEDEHPISEGETDAVQSGQPARTREEAREAVRALLDEGLTDREIARRIGVSPSTVGAIRKAQA